MKTRADVINRAMRRLGVKAEDEALTADQLANVGEAYDALIEEVGAAVGIPLTNAPVPEAAFIPLANLLAVEVAADYGIPAPSRGTAYARVLSALRPDDRGDIPAPEYY